MLHLTISHISSKIRELILNEEKFLSFLFSLGILHNQAVQASLAWYIRSLGCCYKLTQTLQAGTAEMYFL